MSVGYSTNLQLVEPVTGTESGNWGYDINYGTTDYIDISVAGTNNITTDADVTLTQTTGSTSGNNIVGTTAQYMQLLFTGSRTAARNVNAPNISKIYVVNNSTTGGYSITVRGVTGPTTGVTVINGEKCIIAWNSVSGDFVKVATTVISATGLTGVVPTANGGTGVASSVSTIAAFNNSAPGYTTVTAAGTTTTLTAASTYFQKINGSTTQTFQLPDATTLLNGTAFVFDNDSTGNVTINDNSATLVSTVYPGNFQYIFVESNSTAAGSWGKYAFIPAATYVPSGGTGALATTGKAIAMALVFGF